MDQQPHDRRAQEAARNGRAAGPCRAGPGRWPAPGSPLVELDAAALIAATAVTTGYFARASVSAPSAWPRRP